MSKVLVLYTGGTIGMAPSDPTNSDSPLIPQSQAELSAWLPSSLKTLGIEWTLEGLRDDDGMLVEPLDSSDVDSRHWRFMARAIGDAYHDYDGFVILHGTDTMAFTTSALSFMFVNLAKPVVITGSQLPIFDPRTDAIINFVNALTIAGHKSVGLPQIPEVVLCFADVILRGNRARKISSSAWRAFESPNYPSLGRIGEHITIDSSLLLPIPNADHQPFYVRAGLEDNVIDIGLFPGLRSSQLEAVFSIHGLRGAVLRTFGSGNGPSTSDFLDPIQRAVDGGLTLVNVTQCVEGKVEAGLYEASSGLLERGVLSGIDITPEAALAKLMSLLENEPREEARVQMQIDHAGEMSESLFDLRYGEVAESEDGRIVVSAPPPGKFDRRDMTKAMLRVKSVSADCEVRVFVNHPNVQRDASVSEPRYACSLNPTSGSIARDVTSTVRTVAEPGRAITLSLVSGDGTPIGVRGLSLALFTGTSRV